MGGEKRWGREGKREISADKLEAHARPHHYHFHYVDLQKEKILTLWSRGSDSGTLSQELRIHYWKIRMVELLIFREWILEGVYLQSANSTATSIILLLSKSSTYSLLQPSHLVWAREKKSADPDSRITFLGDGLDSIG